MRKLLYAKDSKEFWQVFNEEHEKRRQRLARLPFAKKIEILEKMQADAIPHRKPLHHRRRRIKGNH